MTFLSRIMPLRMLLPMMAAAVVFVLTSATFGIDDGSFAQGTPTPAASGQPQGTPANTDPKTVGPNGEQISCSSLPESRGGFLLGRIIPCLLKTIETSASRFSRGMIDFVQPIFFAFLTFVMVMFGLEVLKNEGQLQTRAFVLLLKIGFVIAVLQMIPGDEQTGRGGLIGVAYGIMNESQAVLMDALGPDAANVSCEIERFGDANTPLIWKQLDCLLGKLYGFTVGGPGPSGEARPNMLLAASVIGLLGGFFFSGTLGAALFIALIGVLISMFTLVIRVVIAFVNSYMFIALYMILAPLLLPLLFLKVTTTFFEKWYSGIIAAILMPIIISAYVVLAMQLYDKLMFADDSLVSNLFDTEWLRDAQELPRQPCSRTITNDPDFRSAASGISSQKIYTGNPFLQRPDTFLSGGNDLCSPLRLPVFNMDATKDKGSYDTAREKFEKLFYDLTKLVILTWLIAQGFEAVKSAIRPMLGSTAVVASLDASSPTEQKIQSAFRNAQNNFQGSFVTNRLDSQGRPTGQFDQTRGAGFLARIPIAAGSAGQGFLAGITGGQSPRPETRTQAEITQARSSQPQSPQNQPGQRPGQDGDDGPSSSNQNQQPGQRPGTTVPRNQVRNAPPQDKIALAVAVLNEQEATEFAQLEQAGTSGRNTEQEARYQALLQQIEGGGN